MKSLGEEESTSKGTGNEPSNPLSSLFRESLALQEKGNLMRAPEAIYTRLHPHQMIALNWMFNREVCPGNSPFWVKEPGGYVSILTGECRRLSAPSDIRGGILADDMGLGKTLTLICLIMTNFYDGRPLAKPLYGYEEKPHVSEEPFYDSDEEDLPSRDGSAKSPLTMK
ncbi:Helicaselike transcription factor putorius [Caligus rogercresseyi]|uniref:Helicaselike transcription factor putorius n=1 Tax=Caligus rogercresseyi TaxID=217165 RepID=A0A7T8GPP5_CALRO|nr:Helicaselike transcription factor putorius [Caligus rogercresseyi]